MNRPLNPAQSKKLRALHARADRDALVWRTAGHRKRNRTAALQRILRTSTDGELRSMQKRYLARRYGAENDMMRRAWAIAADAVAAKLRGDRYGVEYTLKAFFLLHLPRCDCGSPHIDQRFPPDCPLADNPEQRQYVDEEVAATLADLTIDLRPRWCVVQAEVVPLRIRWTCDRAEAAAWAQVVDGSTANAEIVSRRSGVPLVRASRALLLCSRCEVGPREPGTDLCGECCDVESARRGE